MDIKRQKFQTLIPIFLVVKEDCIRIKHERLKQKALSELSQREHVHMHTLGNHNFHVSIQELPHSTS